MTDPLDPGAPEESQEQIIARTAASLLEPMGHPRLLKLISQVPIPGDPAARAADLEALAKLSRQELLEAGRQRLVVDFFASVAQIRRTHFQGRRLSEALGLLLDFPTPPDQVKATRELLITAFKNRQLARIWPIVGLERIAEFVRCPQAGLLRERQQQGQPAILVFWPLGPRFSIGPALRSIGGPALIIAQCPKQVSAGQLEQFAKGDRATEFLAPADTPERGAWLLKRAVERLQAGGFVAIGIDAESGGNSIDADFLNRRIGISKGPAVLARLTGAPIIPLTLAWGEAGWTIDCKAAASIDPPETQDDASTFEHALTRELAHWFDGYVRTAPGQLRLNRLGLLLNAPARGKSLEG